MKTGELLLEKWRSLPSSQQQEVIAVCGVFDNQNGLQSFSQQNTSHKLP